MSCDTQPSRGQTLTQRKEEVLEIVVRLNGLLAKGLVKPKIGPQGAIFFEGWTETDRGRVTDACAYRRLMAIGSTLAKTAIARAELVAGRKISQAALAAGVHSHDGGATWVKH